MAEVEEGIIVPLQHSEVMSSPKPGRYLELFNNYCNKNKIKDPKSANDTAAKGEKAAWMATISLDDQFFVAGPRGRKGEALDDVAKEACFALGLVVEESGTVDGNAI